MKALAGSCGGDILISGGTGMGKLPAELRAALENGGELTVEQLRELISAEARSLNLSFEEAEELATKGKLPKDALGSDLALLFELLFAAA